MTAGRHMALTMWMLALLFIVVFVTSAREGWLRDVAWDVACRDITTSKALSGNANTIQPCADYRRGVKIDN